MASNSEYDQDECSVSVVKNLCCGANPLGAFGLVCLGGVFREDVFPMVGVAFLNMRSKLLNEGGLMTDFFDKDLLFLGHGSPRGLCK